MNNLYINPNNQLHINSLVSNLPQSLLISGETGIGLMPVANLISTEKKIKPIIILPEKNEKVDIENGTIGVEIMRRLNEDTKLKLNHDRIIIIDCSKGITDQAQNAFLKLLEEPKPGYHFILLCNKPNSLLPTILSRVEILKLLPINLEQTNKLIDSLNVTDQTKRAQLIFMAEGLPDEISKLVNNEDYFNSRSMIIRDARDLLKANNYQKLIIINKYRDDRSLVLLLLKDMMKILRNSINSNPQIEAIKKIDEIIDIYGQIEANGNIRICLIKLVI